METYDVILMARSEKRIPIQANCPQSAIQLALDLFAFGGVVFEDEEIVNVSARLDGWTWNVD